MILVDMFSLKLTENYLIPNSFLAAMTPDIIATLFPTLITESRLAGSEIMISFLVVHLVFSMSNESIRSRPSQIV